MIKLGKVTPCNLDAAANQKLHLVVNMTTLRCKYFNRKQRLAPARLSLQTYAGEKVARDYRRYFGMDWPTAFMELEILGVSIPADYKETVLKTLVSIAAAKEQKKAEKLALEKSDQDENFAFNAGYNSGGTIRDYLE